MSRLYLSAAHKSSGKTTISIGLCAALREHKGVIVQPFKKGPDYIDPLWLGAAAQRSCHNLDVFMEGEDANLQVFSSAMAGADIGLIEGNKGLFDGLSVDGSDSNAAMAELLQTPVVLVIDTRGITRGIAPLLHGYATFSSAIDIAGVIFNQVGGERHEGKLRQAVEHYTDIPVIGSIGRDPALEIDERHLGLMPSNEHRQAQKVIRQISDTVMQNVDLDALMSIAATAPELSGGYKERSRVSADIRIGIPRDAAFGFYYTGDLDALRRAGAELVFFDTLCDRHLPQVDGLFIGGGFPESSMQALEDNCSMRSQIAEFIEKGNPVYAECGGLMYLCRSLSWNGKLCHMAGIIPADVKMMPHPQGRGYVQVEETEIHPWPHTDKQGGEIPAHEFHYSKLENVDGPLKFAYRVNRGFGVDGRNDGIVYKNTLASYTHLRDVEGHHWTQRFVNFVRTCTRAPSRLY
jgi:cobyrinic acid a,c-diamide synthase